MMLCAYSTTELVVSGLAELEAKPEIAICASPPESRLAPSSLGITMT